MPYLYPDMKMGKLIKRYKRFTAYIQTEDEVITAHVPNTGSMRSLLGENPVLVTKSDNPKRKLKYTLELISVNNEWIVANTMRVNNIAEHAIITGKIPSLNTKKVQREKTYKDSRFDFYIPDMNALVEVKSVTYFDDENNYFPDAVTTRGKKHLLTLLDAVNEGYRGIMLYMCMAKRDKFLCASHIDSEYCKALEEVTKKGVEVVYAQCSFEKDKNALHVHERKK